MPADTPAAPAERDSKRSSDARAAAPGPPPRGITSRPWWPTAKRALTALFLLGVSALVINQARAVEWSAVGRAMSDYSLPVVLAAAGLAVLSYAIYCTFDLIGRRHVGHDLRTAQVLRVGFISYAFNLSLGSLIGGVALRFRLYAHLGLKTDVTAKVIALSLITNWLGYLFLAGGIFIWRPLALPPEWKLGNGGLRLLGALLLAVALGYLVLCAFSRRRDWTVRGHTVHLPSLRTALLQLVVSSVNWLSIAGVVWVLLQFKIDYPSVLSVLLMAAVAGVVAHVPAGLGVLEAVFIALLLHRSSEGALLAALLAYRLVYYLVPLAIAAVMFAVVEARTKAQAAASASLGPAGAAAPSQQPSS